MAMGVQVVLDEKIFLGGRGGGVNIRPVTLFFLFNYSNISPYVGTSWEAGGSSGYHYFQIAHPESFFFFKSILVFLNSNLHFN